MVLIAEVQETLMHRGLSRQTYSI